MSRIVQTESVGGDRNRLLKGVVIAIRELMKQRNIDQSTKDLAAFIAMALIAVDETIERTVLPWEKRGYWVKADKFRLEWDWVGKSGLALKSAVIDENWAVVASLAASVGGKLTNVRVSDRHRMGKPWVGSWQRMIQQQLEK